NAAQGQLGFTMYADTNGNGSLDPAELAAPVAAGMTAADGLHTSGISAAKGERFWVQVFGIVESGNTIPDKNVYTFTFSNLDVADAGLLAGQTLPDNHVAARAVDLGTGVSWNS